MSTFNGSAYRNAAVRLAVLAAIAGGCGSAFALPQFTFNPSAGGITGAPAGTITADNIVISDYSTVMLGSGNTFTDSGFLSVQSFQSGASVVASPGLNSTYGLYFQFNGSGTVSGGNPATGITSGSFSTLNFTLYGYSGGPAAFSFNGDTPTVSTTGTPIALATGSLVPGSGQSSVGTSPQQPSFNSFAGANLTFTPVASEYAFFASPAGASFYNMAVSSFINSPSQITAVSGGFANGFKISQGGGSVNFASTVPEPSTYGLLLAGLGAIGFVARRRKA